MKNYDQAVQYQAYEQAVQTQIGHLEEFKRTLHDATLTPDERIRRVVADMERLQNNLRRNINLPAV